MPQRLHTHSFKFCHRNICGHLIQYHINGSCSWPGCKCGKLVTHLTPTEVTILRLLILHNQSSKLVAEKLNRSPKTIAAHRFNIYTKLKCHNISELIGFALNSGIVKLDELYKPLVEIGLPDEFN